MFNSHNQQILNNNLKYKGYKISKNNLSILKHKK